MDLDETLYDCSIGYCAQSCASIFDPSKNMAAVTKNRTYWSDQTFLHISQKPLFKVKF